jgi:anti-sigma factor RsiW
MNCEFARTTVHAYFDGELDAVRSADFESHAEICQECQAELKAIGTLHTRLQESDLFEEASPQLVDRIRKQIAQETNQRPLKMLNIRRAFLMPTFGALAGAAAVLAVFLFLPLHNGSTQITAELIDAHVRSLQPGHLTDVLSTDQHTVKPWFDGKLDFSPPVRDFADRGFPLRGGRLDVIHGRATAALVYGRGKHLVSVFIWPTNEPNEAPRAGSRQGYHWVEWRQGGMELCMVSDVAASDLEELRRAFK